MYELPAVHEHATRLIARVVAAGSVTGAQTSYNVEIYKKDRLIS